MSSLRGNARGMGSMGRKPVESMLCGAVLSFVLSFSLEKKGPKVQGRHHRSSPQSGRFPAMSAMANAPNPVKVRQTQFRSLDSLVSIRLRQPCHPHDGLWEAWDLWLTEPSNNLSTSFPITYPTANDNKRLLSTTNVCSTA